MPIIIACPSCNGQLRVADDLIGRKVRCPACNTTFEAKDSAPTASPPPAPPAPVETVPVPAWRNLNLELTEEEPPAAPVPEEPPPEKRNGAALRGAVEVELEPGDVPARPSQPVPEAPPPESEKRKPRWDDREDEDLKPCPVCRRKVERDAKRCPSCGERFEDRRPTRRDEDRSSRRFRRDEDDDFDVRRSRVPRRDCEPHRGGMVLTFGILSTALLTLFFCFIFPPLGLGFGIAAWWMGQVDLRKFRAGTMDPDGEGTTKAGWICGIIGTCLNALVLLGCVSFFAWTWYDDVQRTRQYKQQQVPAPRVTPRKF